MSVVLIGICVQGGCNPIRYY